MSVDDVGQEPPGSDETLVLPIEGGPDLARLRQEVRAFLPGVAENAVADAVLVVVMLAGDAWRYGAPPVSLRLRRSADNGCLRIEVDDHRAARRNSQPEDYRASLLDRMTNTRGVDSDDGTTTTWAEIGLIATTLV